MNKVKLLSLIILILITCTGCTVEYNITIGKDTIIETISVDDSYSSNRTENDILKKYNMWYPTYVNYITQGNETIEIEDFSKKVEGIEYHTKNITKTNNGYQYTYKYTYPLDKYYDAYTLANTFIDSTVHNGYNTLVLKSSKENLLCNYDYFDSLRVNITIDPTVYKLNYTNTQNIINNTYSWTLNRNNCNNSKIILTLDTITDNNITIDEPINNENSKYTIYIFYGILILVVLLGYFIFRKLKNKNEKFDI